MWLVGYCISTVLEHYMEYKSFNKYLFNEWIPSGLKDQEQSCMIAYLALSLKRSKEALYSVMS